MNSTWRAICFIYLYMFEANKYLTYNSTGIIKFTFNCFLKIEIKHLPVQKYIYNDKIDIISTLFGTAPDT